MNTQEARELALANQKEFVQFLNDWHGHHDKDHLKEIEVEDPCEIFELLQKENYTIEELIKTFEETDGDWDSFKQYIENKTYELNH